MPAQSKIRNCRNSIAVPRIHTSRTFSARFTIRIRGSNQTQTLFPVIEPHRDTVPNSCLPSNTIRILQADIKATPQQLSRDACFAPMLRKSPSHLRNDRYRTLHNFKNQKQKTRCKIPTQIDHLPLTIHYNSVQGENERQTNPKTPDFNRLPKTITIGTITVPGPQQMN